FELDPVGAAVGLVGAKPPEAILQAAVGGVARVALGHDDEVRIELVLHVHRRPVARDGLGQRDDLDARALRLALALDGLVVDADPGDAGPDALTHQGPHGHDAAVTRVAVHDHGEAHALGDPARDLHTLGHGRGADVGQSRVGADHAARAHERHLAAGLLHE